MGRRGAQPQADAVAAARFEVLTREVITESIKETLRMDARKLGLMNPVVYAKFRSTAEGVPSHVLIVRLDEDGNEAALVPAGQGVDGALKLQLSKSQRTARFSMARLVMKHPALKVAKDRQREFPVSLREENGRTVLVIDLKGSTVVVPQKNKSSDEESAEGDKPEKAAKAKKSPATENKSQPAK